MTTLGMWRFFIGSLALADIKNRKIEALYWLTILFSNTLGTALGDYLADDLHLGFAGGALLIGLCLVALMLAAFYTRLSKTLLFWAAFVLTRPFGATMGDFLTKEQGGLNLGTQNSSLVLALILAAGIAATHYQQKKSA